MRCWNWDFRQPLKQGESTAWSRAGAEQVPVQQLLQCCGTVQNCAIKTLNWQCELGVSLDRPRCLCLRVLLSFPCSGLCFFLQVCLCLHLYPQFLTFRILSLPLPFSQLWSENHWGWTLDFLVEYLLFVCSCFFWGFKKKKKGRNETSSPGTCRVFRAKAGHEKGHFPFLSNWLWFLRSITLECSPETPIFLWGGSRANWFKLLLASAGNFHQKLITASSSHQQLTK